MAFSTELGFWVCSIAFLPQRKRFNVFPRDPNTALTQIAIAACSFAAFDLSFPRTFTVLRTDFMHRQNRSDKALFLVFILFRFILIFLSRVWFLFLLTESP